MARRLILIACLFVLTTTESLADLVVIVNSNNGINKLSRDEVVNIFLGRNRQFPNGQPAQPMDLAPTQPEKAHFYQLLVNKDLAEINAYWARLVFSGRTSPPKQAGGNEELVSYVAASPSAIGYVDRSKLSSRVKVIYEFSESR